VREEGRMESEGRGTLKRKKEMREKTKKSDKNSRVILIFIIINRWNIAEPI
jgi:hypothetical protein